MQEKILLVEDDRDIVDYLSSFLKNENFIVEAVAGQREAIEKLETREYDLLLIDISLADGNGYAVCAAAKEKSPAAVIFLTASGDEYSVVTGLDMGADDYINKPFAGTGFKNPQCVKTDRKEPEAVKRGQYHRGYGQGNRIP